MIYLNKIQIIIYYF
jgi:hypothetical protein